MTARNILVAEDEALLLDVVSEELRDAGFTVLQAMTAEDALSVVRSDTPLDVLFTDIRFPKPLDGWQLAELAREFRPNIGIIYATGFSVEAPRLVPSSRLLRKPYRVSAVIEALEELLPWRDLAG